MPSTTFLSAAALVALLTVAGCGSDPGQAASSQEPAQASPSAMVEESASAEPEEEAPAEPVVIEIEDFKFAGPKSVTPGATVEVKNEDRSSHTVTSENGAFEEVIVEGGGDTGTFQAPTEPGTYAYVCRFHPEMKATLVVE